MKIQVNKPQTKIMSLLQVSRLHECKWGPHPQTNEKAFIQFLQGNGEDHPIINLLPHKSQQVNK